MAVTTKPYGDSETEVKKGRGEAREWVSVGIRARGGSDSGGKGTPFVFGVCEAKLTRTGGSRGG